MINKLVWLLLISLVIGVGMLTGCNQILPPQVTLQAVLSTPTLEPTFTHLAMPVITGAPLPPTATSSPTLPASPTPVAQLGDALAPSSGEITTPFAMEEKITPVTIDVTDVEKRSNQTPQVVLVLDVSGSMDEYVLPKQLPADLGAIRAQLEKIENDPEYIRLQQQLDAIYADPKVEAADQTWADAEVALDDWLFEHGYGESLDVITAKVSDLLTSYGCADYTGYYLTHSDSLAEIEERLSYVCEGVTLNEAQRQTIENMVAYLEDADYQALQQQEADLFDAYLEARNALGYEAIDEQFDKLLAAQKYDELQEEFEALAKAMGVPTRLDLAKQAALTLLDLSRLDTAASGGESPVGLVAFSDHARLHQSLVTNYDWVETSVNSLDYLGSTNIGDGLKIALAELAQNGDRTQPAAVILLSDGQTNRGLKVAEILAQIPIQAQKLDARICTVGFGNNETEIDIGLLQGLAEATGGEYLFATTGEELITFFVACRQGLVSDVIDQFTALIRQEETVEAGRFVIQENVAELTLTFNYLQGNLVMELVDSEGSVIDSAYPGVIIQQGDKVQLVKITNPRPGEWIVRVTANEVPQDNVIYSIVVSTELRPPAPTPSPTLMIPSATPVPTLVATPTPLVAVTPAPSPTLLVRLRPYLAPGIVGLGLIVTMSGLAFIFVYLKRSGG